MIESRRERVNDKIANSPPSQGSRSNIEFRTSTFFFFFRFCACWGTITAVLMLQLSANPVQSLKIRVDASLLVVNVATSVEVSLIRAMRGTEPCSAEHTRRIIAQIARRDG